jgi:hypothetical protein
MAPRLLYHRHFMLTESLGRADFLDPRVRDLTSRAIARQLLREHQGNRIVLSRLTHDLPTMEQFQSSPTLDAPESYFEEPLGQFQWTDFYK